MLNKDDGFSRVGAELEAVHVKRVTLRTNGGEVGYILIKTVLGYFSLVLVTHIDGRLKSLPRVDW